LKFESNAGIGQKGAFFKGLVDKLIFLLISLDLMMATRAKKVVWIRVFATDTTLSIGTVFIFFIALIALITIFPFGTLLDRLIL
jgi:hypothetical protein